MHSESLSDITYIGMTILKETNRRDNMQREFDICPIPEEDLPSEEFDRDSRDDFHQNGWHSANQTILPSQRWLNRIVGGPTKTICVFCRNNGESVDIYSSHVLKEKNGFITCPILWAYKCPYCGATREHAHTKNHCPLKRRHLLLGAKKERNNNGRNK